MTSDTRFTLLVIALGAVAAASVAFLPFESFAGIESADLPIVRVAAAAQAIILVSLAALAGCWAAPKMGLDAPWLRFLANRTKQTNEMPSIFFASTIVAFAVAVLLVAIDALVGDTLSSGSGPAAELGNLEMPLVTKILYGGVAEEIMVRWGLLSLIAVGLTKLKLNRVMALSSAVVLSSLVFAAGHLPLLFQIVEAPSLSLVMTIVIANTAAGTAFAILFVKRGLEAAVIAHAGAHILSSLWFAFSA